jgi:hypothetical protein
MARRLKKPCSCGKPSVPGLKPGQSLCQYHYNVAAFGKDWADRCRKEAEDFMAGSKERKK